MCLISSPTAVRQFTKLICISIAKATECTLYVTNLVSRAFLTHTHTHTHTHSDYYMHRNPFTLHMLACRVSSF